MIELEVKNVTCGNCASTVTRAIHAMDPEAEVHVDVPAKRVRVNGKRSSDEIARALAAAGYPATQATAPKGCCCR